MTKRQLIDEIVSLNHSAQPGFLAQFEHPDLDEYLRHLMVTQSPRLAGDPHRFDHYFDRNPAVAIAEPAVSVLQDHGDEPVVPIDAHDQSDVPSILDLNATTIDFFSDSYSDPSAGQALAEGSPAAVAQAQANSEPTLF